METLIEKLFKPFHLNSGHKTACLVSGGVDSMVLLEMVNRFRKQNGFGLVAVHFNFHLRGFESDRDEKFVHEESAKRGIPFCLVSAPLEKGAGIQLRAREKRYSCLADLGKKGGWTHAFTGHQADDQAETVIMRIIRGAGLKGLSGIPVETILESGLKVARPMLLLSREEIELIAKREGVRFVVDSSNNTSAYFRNRVRHDILPELKRQIPGFLESVGRACRQIGRKARLVEKSAEVFLSCCPGDVSTACRMVPKDGYFALGEDERFEALRFLVKEAGFLRQFEKKHFDEIESLLAVGKAVKREYGDVFLLSENGRFCLVSGKIMAEKEAGLENFCMKIDSPGAVRIEPIGKTLVLESTVCASGNFDSLSNLKPPNKRLYLDLSRVDFPLTARFPRPGDRFSPFGMTGAKKLSDYFTDRKVPRGERRRRLVLCSRDRIVCIVGDELDNRFKIASTGPMEAIAAYFKQNG